MIAYFGALLTAIVSQALEISVHSNSTLGT